MAWQNPKTNWVAGDIPGAGDFNRIEGNAEYLKTQTDGLKNGSIKAGKAKDADTVGGVHAKIIVPSTSNLLSATAERYTPNSNVDPVILKRFKLGYPGKCNLRYEYRGSYSGAPAIFTAELWMNNKIHSLIGSVKSGDERYYTYETEVTIPFPAMEIVIRGQSGKDTYGYIRQGRVRNAYIRGSLIQIDPSIQVVTN